MCPNYVLKMKYESSHKISNTFNIFNIEDGLSIFNSSLDYQYNFFDHRYKMELLI